MRLWSLHPKYLDSKGLLALWREALLAQEVLRENTKGYRHHPQLERFRTTGNPLSAISAYLLAIQKEGARRGYNFNASKIGPGQVTRRMPVTEGQLRYELAHLRKKISTRDQEFLNDLKSIECPDAHPLFKKISGSVEPWERA
ncbi:MAG TPA: pyrimidine dimer DNA glycosylase/endonuclease V [Desulfatiglandales bacterium]|nr:pyrimidine dimer DNA glycosylase/endonuclease V [Desulfatiglandales bacterium]